MGRVLRAYIGDNAEPLFMTNPLFLFFCTWLTQHSDAYFVVKNIENVRHTIENYIVKKINTTLLDCSSIATKFPAIDIEKAIENNDRERLGVYSHVLSKCHNVRILESRK